MPSSEIAIGASLTTAGRPRRLSWPMRNSRRITGAKRTRPLAVSADPVKAQDKFKTKYDLSIPLASDETHKMLAAYGVWGEKSMYGRKYMGVTRATFLIDKKGRIAKVWPKVSVDGHAEEVLEAAKAL